jgi:hypothetical protein
MTYLLKLCLALGLLVWIPASALASSGMTYVPLVGIPGLDGDLDFNDYINALYALSISLAALIAVVKIVIAGAKYMLDPLVSGKSEAKSDITNALIGLLIIIGAVVLLNTVNSDLTNLQITAKPAVVDDSAPPGTITAKAYCDQLNLGGKPCTGEWCSAILANYGYYINPGNVENPSCSYICERVPGFLTDGGWNDVTSVWGTEAEDCQYSEELLQENLDAYFNKVKTSECVGEEDCDLKICTKIEDRRYDGSSEEVACRNECEILRQGEYLPKSGACIFTSGIYLTEAECNSQPVNLFSWDETNQTCRKTDPDGSSSYTEACLAYGDGTGWDCEIIKNICIDEQGGAEVIDGDESTFTCKVPSV